MRPGSGHLRQASCHIDAFTSTPTPLPAVVSAARLPLLHLAPAPRLPPRPVATAVPATAALHPGLARCFIAQPARVCPMPPRLHGPSPALPPPPPNPGAAATRRCPYIYHNRLLGALAAP
ncbi:hypothetical protein E2562_033983 [Oryza meyeriana var. granulata]|uniref:Uncharacterized protein n=1 Tax=Oryza meyeriana var. granulata TaxID=110450 RepID=A0A6G1ES54_9ORYZ|nr:hypothetical protein E2562_033983 [Oryza meyeriana var. granulata]